MKKTIFLRTSLVVLLLLFGLLSYAQLAIPFTPRLTGGNIKVKGDIVLIGNSIIKGKGLPTPYNGTDNNNNNEGEYIDVDSDGSTFSSSTAELAINNSCKKIAYAGLYWASIYPNEVATDSNEFFKGTPRLNDWNVVKFKLPTGGYIDLTADKADPKEVIYDGYNYTNINNSFKDSPIICYKDVTSLLSNLTEADGTYTLANLRATRGERQGGCAAGWTLVVIYESPTMPSKFISVFDGYAGVQGNTTLDIPVSGFNTLPSPFPVNAKIGVSALEGDLGISGDTFQFKAATKAAYTKISDAVSLVGNFFNSTNSNGGVQIVTGNPASKNLLGYDIKNVVIPNALNAVIPNNETAGAFKLTTSGDGYGAFVTTFAVEIIEPTILLTKQVVDNAGADASNANVTLSQQLNYIIGFENQGNDDASGFTIKDILPINIKFNYPADIDAATLPPGVTHSYDAATRTIIFAIPDALVKANLTPGPPFVHYSIKFKVKVVDTCNELSDACDNIIKNSAFATYKGSINPTQITDDPSLSSFTACNLGTPQATNFLVGVKDCLFTKNAVLCGSSSLITASNGYASYNWTGPYGFTATGQSVTVTQPGVYKVFGVGNKPCTDYNEVITVAPFGGTATNPVIPFADNPSSPVCPNNGVFLPKIFLCGASDSRNITTGISGALSIVWETTTCVAPTALPTDCANDSSTCVWASAGPNGPNFSANTAGQYRLTINYAGGCFNRYYFNVYKNVLNANVSKTDIYCSTPGKITVGGVPTGYEYSLDGTNYQASNVFSITTPNTYNISIRQIGVASNPCIFKVNNITISKNDLTVTLNATQPACFGDKATILAVANNVRPQYQFDLYIKGTATLVNSSGLINASNQFLFVNVNPGDYDIKTKTVTASGVIECTDTQSIKISEPKKLSATSALTKPLTCEDGTITVTPSGGTSPYYYSVNGSAYVTDPVIPVTLPLPAGGVYTISVADKNNCTTTTSITVTANLIPVYTLSSINNKCYGDNSGEIKFNVTNANGYILSYSIDNGVSFQSNATFSNLTTGTYTPVLQYNLSGVVCTDVRPVVVITAPGTALTASGGVAELAGCGAAGTGLLRITNAQGGTPNYQYSFDGGGTWQTINEKYVAPGTYTLVIKDAVGCTFTMPGIILDNKPADPIINENVNAIYNCDGSATATIEVNTPTTTGGTTYTYEYYLKTGSGAPVPNTPLDNNIFINVPSGPHTVIVKYNVQTVSSYSNLLQEDFGKGGFTTTPGINPAYCFEDETTPHPVGFPCGSFTDYQINDGKYAVASTITTNFGGSWLVAKDHTLPANSLGRFLCVNVGGSAGIGGILYSKPITDVLVDQPVIISLWAENLIVASKANLHDPKLTIQLVNNLNGVGGQETIVATTDTTNPWVVPKSEKWEYKQLELNPGAYTNLSFVIRSYSNEFNGNDVLLDDIYVRQVPKSCGNERSFPIVIDGTNAFAASVTGHKDVSCAGSADGTITIAAQNFATTGFFYAVDGAVTFSKSTSSPLVITGLAAGNHTVKVQYDLTASPCLISLPQTITAPLALVTTGTVSKPASCITGATITASSSGGTTAYSYELWNSTNTTIIKPLQNTGVFTNVTAPGSYYVRGYDANGCTDTTDSAITVTAPTGLTATIVAGTNRCFDTTTGANITVNITGGVGPFSYQTSTNGGSTYSGSSTSFNGPAFTYNATTTGSYLFKVTDTNGCSTTVGQVINAKLSAVASVTTALDCDIAPNDAAVITGTISGGTAPFTVVKTVGPGTITPIVSGSTFTYTTTLAGAYSFEITDSFGCIITTSATISALVAVTGNATPTDVTCYGADNGSVTLTALTGVAPFTYNFNNLGFSNTTTYGSLAGTITGSVYPYVIKDAKGCVYNGTVTIKQPAAIAGTAAITTPYTCDSPATITVSGISGGNGSNIYSLNRGATVVASQSTLVFSNVSVPGSYTVTITDSKGCTITTAAMPIIALNPPTAMTLTASAVTCPTNTASVTISGVLGSTGTLSYKIIAPAAATTNITGASNGIFTGLAAGITYTFEAKDANNCTYSKPVTINALPTIAVVVKSKTDVVCFGSSDGSAIFTISGMGNSVGYSYTIDGVLPATTGTSPVTGTSFDIAATALNAINHTIIVTNTTSNCSYSQTVTIATPAVALSLNATTLTHVTCIGKGKAIINAVGGWMPYASYVLTPTLPAGPAITQSTKTFNNLAAGAYTVVVTDKNGCTVTQNFTINDKVALIASIDPTTDLCYTTAGVTIKVSPITALNYVYSINGGTAQINGTFANLTPGKYTIRVTDKATTCYIDLPEQTVSSQLTASTNLFSGAKCSTPDVVIKGTVSGGTPSTTAPNYTYVVAINGTLESPATTHTVTGTTFTYTDTSGIPQGATFPTVYDFTFTDSKGCTTTSTTTVQPKTNPKIISALQVNPIYCSGESTGSIKVLLDYAFGTSPYVINVSETTIGTNYGTKTTGLPAGNYTIKVTDANGCTDPVTNVVIGEPAKIDFPEVFTPITCSGTAGGGTAVGTISVTALTGGTMNPLTSLPITKSGFIYTLTSNTSPTQTFYPNLMENHVFMVLSFGIYELTVTDFNGCSFTREITIASPPTDLDISVVAGSASCTDASLVVKATPIVPGGPYYFAKYPIDPANPGNYDYATNAAFYQNADAVSPPALSGDPLLLQSTFTGLNPGVTYSFIVYDAFTSCYFFKQADSATLTSSILMSTVTPKNVSCQNAADGKVSFTLSNFEVSTTDVKYEIFNSQSNLAVVPAVAGIVSKAVATTGYDIPDSLVPGTYYILFTEVNGVVDVCQNASATFTIKQSVVPLTATASAPKNDNCGHTGQIIAAGQGGTAPYQYELVGPVNIAYSTNAVFPNPSSASVLIAGNYTVNVKDANGCIFSVPVILNGDPEPVITAVVNGQCSATEGNFGIDVALTTPGIGTHTYSLDGGAFVANTATFTYSHLSSGPHTVEVKDVNGCGNLVSTIMIYPPLDIKASFTILPTCKNADGTITAVASGGETPNNFEYTLVNNTVVAPNVVQMNDPVFLNQAAGNYTIKVRDINTNCTKSVTIDLLIPTDVTFTLADITITSPTCLSTQGNASNGSIEVKLPAVNDNPPYTYTLTPTTSSGAPVSQVSNGLFTGLTIGTYDITVTSDKGCSLTLPLTIVDPAPVVAVASPSAFTCSATNTFNATMVTVTGSGGAGTNPVTDYLFSENGTNWFTTNTFDVLDNGSTQSLTYYVKDANGCTDDVTIPIAPFPKLVSAIATQVTAIDCINGGEVIKVDITGGTNTPNAFTYQVYKDGVLIPGLTPVIGSTFNYIAATAGSYYEFEIFDNNTGCSIKSAIYDVPVFNTINVIAATAANAKCNSDANGAIEINITGYIGAYTYEIYNAGVLTAFTGTGNTSVNPFVLPDGLVAGTNYTVKVIETAYPQCSFPSNAVVITEPVVLALSNIITVVNKNCFNEATATVPITSVTGGTPSYTYAFAPSGTAAGSLVFSTSNTATIPTTAISPATDAWDVWVKDANDCTSMQTIQVTADPLPVITNVVADQCPSPTGTYDITVTATTFNGAIEYSLDAVSFQNSNVFTVSSPANYTVTVRDANQCTVIAATPVTILQPLQLQADITKTPTCTTADGEVTLTASGGTVTPSYEYSIDGITYVPTNVFNSLAPNTYSFYVRDTGTSCIKQLTVIINAPNTAIDFGLTKTDVTCNGGNDGTILVTLTTPTTTVNNNPIYTYRIDGGAYQESNLFEGLTAGSHTVDVLSGKGCPATSSITVGGPGLIMVPTPTVLQYGCTTGNTTNFATITVSGVTGGSGTYANYEFSKGGSVVYFGPSNTFTASDLLMGSYTVKVYDSNGCVGSTTAAVVINPFIALDKINVAITTPITCNDKETITLTVDTNGGTPAAGDLTYTVTGYTGTTYNDTNTTGIFSNLVVGQYLIDVTNTATGCNIQTVHYVNEPNTFELKASNIVDLKCFADTDGSALVTLVDTVITTSNPDQAGPFNYTVKDALGVPVIPSTLSTGVTANITGLKAGVYTVEATLANTPYCSVSTIFSITGPTAALSISETHTEITCVAADSGSISVKAIGGWAGNYQFELVGPVSVAYGTQTYFGNLTAGSYVVNVKDSSGCVASVGITLVNPNPISITATASPTMLSCFGDQSGTVTASSVSGGQGANYLYTLNTTSASPMVSSGPQSSPAFSGLGIGTYTITVTDGWGCSMTSTPVAIIEPAVVAASLVVASTQTCAVQTQLTLTATGGTGVYTYSADNITFSTTTFASSITFPVPVGTYHYYVKDANGCSSSVSNDIKIDPVPTLNIKVDQTNAVINCKGDVTGVIVTTAEGGLGNYTFTLLDGAGLPITPAPTQTTPGNFTQLAAGFYQVQVTSGADCGPVKTAVIEIKEPAVGLTAIATPTNVTCNGAANGKIIVTASGGTGIIKYAITPYLNQFFDSNIFENLKTGSYDLIAQDENGCYVYMAGILIDEPSPLKATLITGSIIPEVCSGDNDAEFSIAITGGTLPYKVSLDKENGPFTTGTAGQTDFNFQNIKGGSHIVYVVDAMGCNYNLTVVLPDPVTLNPVAIIDYDCLNNLPNNTVTVKVDSSIVLADVDYALDGIGTYQASNVFANVSSGTHFVSVRHTNGCIKQTQNFTILQINPLAVSMIDGGLNEIIATTTGGSGTYHYTFNGESTGTSNTYIYYSTGNYTVEVIDSEGCTATDTKPFTFIDFKIPNVFTPDGDGNNDTWGPTNTNNYPDLIYNIYDRYGRTIATYHKDQFWDGKYNGFELPSGDYWYTLRLNNDKDGREFVGHFTLYR